MGLPWWSSGQESAFQGRDVSLIPGQGTKIPHATRQLSPTCTTMSPNAATTEKPMHCSEEPAGLS